MSNRTTALAVTISSLPPVGAGRNSRSVLPGSRAHHRTSARPRSGALTQRCRPGLGSFIHNQKRLGERVNEILGDVHSRDTRLDQRQGRRDEPVKLWSECRIRCRNQPIKRCLNERPARDSCRRPMPANRSSPMQQSPTPTANVRKDFMRLSRPNCRPKCKTINPGSCRYPDEGAVRFEAMLPSLNLPGAGSMTWVLRLRFEEAADHKAR